MIQTQAPLFCFDVAPNVCAIWDPTISFWELLATILFTGLVTYVTITVSVSRARKETDRVLAETRYADRAEAIVSIVRTFSARQKNHTVDEILGDPGQSAEYNLALARLRATGAPFAADVTAWVEEVDNITGFLDGSETFDLDELGNAMLKRSPGTVISGRLLRWHEDPDSEGPRFAPQTTIVHDWFLVRVQQELDKEREQEIQLNEIERTLSDLTDLVETLKKRSNGRAPRRTTRPQGPPSD